MSSRGCRRWAAFDLLDVDWALEPCFAITQFCDKCDLWISKLVDWGGPGKLLGVEISSTWPLIATLKQYRQTGIIAEFTLEQTEYIDRKLQHWCQQDSKTLVMDNGEPLF